ncbi:MAG: hypothetical protein ACFFED_08030 [Candidatus Thorarchaeota archaeon]
MEFDMKELAGIIERLLNEKAQERKKELMKKRMESDDFIKDVHEADIGIDPNELEVLSQTTTEEGDVIVEWKAIEYVLTEFTVDEPYQFEKRGKILLRKNGEAELLT